MAGCTHTFQASQTSARCGNNKAIEGVSDPLKNLHEALENFDEAIGAFNPVTWRRILGIPGLKSMPKCLCIMLQMPPYVAEMAHASVALHASIDFKVDILQLLPTAKTILKRLELGQQHGIELVIAIPVTCRLAL